MSSPIVSISAETTPTEGGVVGTYLITLDTPAPAGGLTVSFDTTGSTATLNDDYNFTLGANLTAVTLNSFTIAEGASSATLNLVVNADAVADSNETVAVNLVAGADYQITSGTFASKVDYVAGNPSVFVSVADFNNDGKLDLAVVNDNGATVSILLRNATNTGFDPKIDYAAGLSPHALSAGDFNNDGKTDLVVSHIIAGTVSVLLRNTTNTGFDSPVDYATGAWPWSISVGDFNNDGKTDLAVANLSSSTVSVLLRNTTNTGFDSKVDYVTGANPFSVSTGDFNNDGKLDLAVTNINSNTVSVFLRNTDNTGFDPKIDYVTGSAPWDVSVGDFNNDGKLDLAVSNWNGNTVSVLLRNAANTGFDARVDYVTGFGPRDISVGDFNNDGKLDLSVVNFTSNAGNTVSVLLRNATNTGFDPKIDYATASLPNSVSVGDLNNDGKLDLAVAYSDGNIVSVLLNNSAATATLTIANIPPTLTTLTSPVTTGNEDSEMVVTFADLQAQGNETDVDGAVVGFVVKAVSTGSLKIGADTATATDWNALSNNTIDATHQAWWTPALNANGTLNAFKIVAKDDGGLESATPVQATVSVTPVNDAPTLTNFGSLPVATLGNVVINAGTATLFAASGVSDVAIQNAMGLSGTLDSLAGGNATAGAAALFSFITLPTASTLTFNWSFSGSDAGNSIFRDFSFVEINGVAQLLRQFGSGIGAGSGIFSTTLSAGTHTFGVGSMDFADFIFSPILVVNHIAINGIVMDSFSFIPTGTEDSQMTVSFANLQKSGDEADVDGLVVGFVVKAVSTGSLKIGASAATATDWDALSNNTIDATHQAYWTPAANTNGTLNAFTVVAKDNGGLESVTPTQVTVSVLAVNDAPTLTTFSAPVSAGNEDSEMMVSFADLQAQGDDTDVDGSVDAFVVKTVSSGSLKIGLSASTATAWDALSNNTIDATHQAYWTPAANANGTLNAFTVVAKDNAGLESVTPVQATVSVAAVPDVNVTAGVTPVEGGTKGTFIITLDSPAPVGGLTVNYTLAGTATLVTDYTVTAGSHVTAMTGSSFTIAAGETSAVLKVKAVNDAAFDPDETVSLNLTTGAGYQLASGTFSPKVDYATDLAPLSVDVGDFNNDGKLDLAIANGGSNTVSVLLRNAANTGFDTKIDYATGSFSSDVSVGDFNNDGKVDLAVANQGSNTVSVLLRNAANTGFDAKVDYVTGANPASVSVGDFNNDGKLDLAIANEGSNTVSVLLRNATNTGFDAKIDYVTGSTTASVSAGDFNNDGKLDLVVANHGDSTVSVLLRNTTNTGFDTKVDYATGTNPVSVNVGDFNNDGKLDLAVANVNGGSVSVLLRNATNTGFDTKVDYATGSGSYSVSVGDLNNDGKLDLAVANWNGGTVSVLFRNATNTGFDTKVDYVAGTNPDSVSVGDFDNNGKLDLAVAKYYNPSGNTVSVFLNGSNPTATLTITDPNNPHIYHGHSYFLTDPNLTWQQAQAQATSFGGNLVTINNQAEQTWLTNTFANASSNFVSGWIGYTDQDTEGVFKWISGEHSAYTNWDTGEPNNLGDEDYAQMYARNYRNGLWNDVNASNAGNGLLRGIIEINSTLVGTSGDDIIKGTHHDDLISGLAGADTMRGGKGNDRYYVDNIGDVAHEHAHEGKDTVYSTVSYTLSPNVENLVLIGTEALIGRGNVLDNHLTGNSADNLLNGEAGADTMWGDKGNDIYVVDNTGDVVKERADEGIVDVVYSSISYHLTANVENLVLTGTAANGTGNALSNRLFGNDTNNVLDGGKGYDFLDGGAGADIMRGGKDDDSYYVDNVGDVVKEYAHQGEDTVYSTISYTLTSNVENLVLIGSGAINGMGNELNNHLTGNSADNHLNGKGGADTMEGGKGNDSYYVDNVGDVVNEHADEDYDIVFSSISYTLTANVEYLALTTAVTDINGTGNALQNILFGNGNNNILDGGAGNDTLYGRDGGDTLYGGDGNDLLYADDGVFVGGWEDTLIGGLGQDEYAITETIAATDTVRIATGDSLVSSYDRATGFVLGTGIISTTGVDQLDLDSTIIAADTAGVNGADAGIIHSHSINSGIISFDDVDSYATLLAVVAANLANVLSYLQTNITDSKTVAFVAGSSTFVFQDGGVTDTLVELVGVTAGSINTTGLATDALWIV